MVITCFLMVVFSGNNTATDVCCCFGKHCKRDDELHLPLLAWFGCSVGMLIYISVRYFKSKLICSYTDINLNVCALQWICSSQQSVSDLHLYFSVCLHLVEEAPRYNMGRWWRVVKSGDVMILKSHLLLFHVFLINVHKWVSPSPCRLVCGITAGMGLLHEACHPQHINEVLWVVGLWVWGILCR